MPLFNLASKCFGTATFAKTLKEEILQLEHSQLPLQKALTQTSYVSDSDFSVVILNSEDDKSSITAKVGIFYFGIISGSCCSDDPTPVDEMQEYCEVEFLIDKETGEVTISLLES